MYSKEIQGSKGVEENSPINQTKTKQKTKMGATTGTGSEQEKKSVQEDCEI